MSVNLAEAKAKLSAYVDRASAGEQIVIAKAGKPVARLMPLEDRPRRRIGVARHWLDASTVDLGDLETFAPEPDNVETPTFDQEWHIND